MDRFCNPLILMNGDEIEPIALLLVGPEELDLSISEGPKESLISHVAQAVQGELGSTFLQ